MSRRHDVRRVHSHRSYTAADLADALDVTIGTVRRWVGLGLKPIEAKRPHLFHPHTIKDFLASRAQPYQPCKPGELYCTACKKPREPLHGMIYLVPRSDMTVDFTALCPDCYHQMFRRSRISEIAANLGPAKLSHEDVTTTFVGEGVPPQTTLSGEAAS